MGDEFSGADSSLVFGYRISVRGRDLKGAIGKINVYIFSKVFSEPVFLTLVTELRQISLHARQVHYLAFCKNRILGDNDIVQEDSRHGIFD